MSEIRFRILGPVCIVSTTSSMNGDTTTGEERPLPSMMVRGLLVTLLMAQGRIVVISQLHDTLWDEPPPSARSNIRTYAARLRRELAVEFPASIQLKQSGGGYGLSAPASHVDLMVFRTKVSEARQLIHTDAAEAVVLLRAALSLWRGSVGEDLPPAITMSTLAHGVNQERLNAFEDLGQALVASGRPDAAAAELSVHVSDHPNRERAWVLLACAHYINGDPTSALDAAGRAREVISEALGLNPGQDLQALVQAVLHRDDDWFWWYARHALQPRSPFSPNAGKLSVVAGR